MRKMMKRMAQIQTALQSHIRWSLHQRDPVLQMVRSYEPYVTEQISSDYLCHKSVHYSHSNYWWMICTFIESLCPDTMVTRLHCISGFCQVSVRRVKTFGCRPWPRSLWKSLLDFCSSAQNLPVCLITFWCVRWTCAFSLMNVDVMHF